MNPPPPFRFVGLVVGGWVGLRVLAWMPSHELTDASEAPGTSDNAVAASAVTARPTLPSAAVADPERTSPVAGQKYWPHIAATEEADGSSDNIEPDDPFALHAHRLPGDLRVTSATSILEQPQSIASLFQAAPATMVPPPSANQVIGAAPAGLAPAGVALSAAIEANRLAASAWLFVRDGGSGLLLPAGSLGGSQAGARVTYRINVDARRPLALSARAYSALEQPHGAEVALGIDWRPLARVPVHLLAERRERLGSSGRSDWQLTAYGGFDLRRRRVHVEGYGQAGVVAVDHPDLFVDGAVRAGVTAGPVEVGAGAWGGAQPGAERLDIGPRAGAHLRFGRVQLRAEADWRFRVAGSAAPGSGPALTISAGF